MAFIGIQTRGKLKKHLFSLTHDTETHSWSTSLHVSGIGPIESELDLSSPQKSDLRLHDRLVLALYDMLIQKLPNNEVLDLIDGILADAATLWLSYLGAFSAMPPAAGDLVHHAMRTANRDWAADSSKRGAEVISSAARRLADQHAQLGQHGLHPGVPTH